MTSFSTIMARCNAYHAQGLPLSDEDLDDLIDHVDKNLDSGTTMTPFGTIMARCNAYHAQGLPLSDEDLDDLIDHVDKSLDNAITSLMKRQTQLKAIRRQARLEEQRLEGRQLLLAAAALIEQKIAAGELQRKESNPQIACLKTQEAKEQEEIALEMQKLQISDSDEAKSRTAKPYSPSPKPQSPECPETKARALMQTTIMETSTQLPPTNVRCSVCYYPKKPEEYVSSTNIPVRALWML